MTRKEIKSQTIKQDNDASCFNGHCNDQNGSQHNKRAKRLASELPTTLKGRGFPLHPRSPKYPIKDARSYTKSTGFTFGRSARSLSSPFGVF